MALSGWFVLLVAIGAAPIVVLGDPAILGVWLLLVLAIGVLDLLLAGSPRAVRFTRDLPDRVRLGETAMSTLFLVNTGRRRVVGRIPGRTGRRRPAGEWHVTGRG